MLLTHVSLIHTGVLRRKEKVSIELGALDWESVNLDQFSAS